MLAIVAIELEKVPTMPDLLISSVNEAGIASALNSGINTTNGITQQYLEQNRDGAPAISIVFIGALVVVVLLLRCYARFFVQQQFGLDDALAILTMLPYISFLVLSIIMIRIGAGRHIEYFQFVMDEHQQNIVEIMDFAAHLLYTTALFICRLSGLAFYYRLGEKHSKLLLIINIAAVFLTLAYIPQMVLLLVHCLPVTGLWPWPWQDNYDKYTCLPWGTVYVTNSVLSLVCDFVIFGIPATIISMVRRTNIKKWKLSLVLFPGVLVIAISGVRLFLVVRGYWVIDASWGYNPLLAIENAEIGGTLFALCVPALKPLFTTIAARISSSMHSSSYTTSHEAPRNQNLNRNQHLQSGSDVKERPLKVSVDVRRLSYSSDKISLHPEMTIVKDSEIRTKIINDEVR